MSSTEQERANFLKTAILVVDHSKAALISLIELDLQNKHLTFEQFLNQNQHEIYHLCYTNVTCCRCLPGTSLPRRNRIIFPSQMEILFDKAAKKPGHSKGPDFCCSYANKGICTDVLDLTLARCLLVNCCTDVFWFSCLQFQGISFEDFLNHNKHLIYHLWHYNHGCCYCPNRFQLPVNFQIVNTRQWNSMFAGSTGLPVCRKRSYTGGTNCICSISAISGINQGALDSILQQNILKYCCSNRKSMDVLVNIRNDVYAHAKAALINCKDYTIYKNDIEKAALDIAIVCGKEPEFRTALNDVNQRRLDHTLLLQYQTSLLERKTDASELVNLVTNQFQTLEENIKEHISAKLQKLEVSKRDPLIGLTQTEIDGHLREGTFVETPAVQACIKLLETNSLLILTGAAGTGKSRNSLEILHQFRVKHPEYETVKLTDLHDFTDVVTEELKLVILFEDIFGRTNTRFAENTDVQIIDRIHACTTKGNIKVILTVRDTIRMSCQWILNSHKIFHGKCEVDLSSEKFKMKKKEKESLLLKYFTAHNFQLLEYNDLENYFGEVILDPHITVTINRVTFHNIVESEPLLGFPEACSLFTGNRKFTRLGLSFFKHPSKYLYEEIENLRINGAGNHEDRMSYIALVYIFLNEDILDQDDVDGEKFQKILESCYGYASGKLPICYITDAAKRLIGKYLTFRCDKGTYHFQHQTIFESILISYSRIDQNLILSRLSFDFTRELVRLQKYSPKEGEILMKISPKHYSKLADRIIEIIQSEYFNNALSINLQLLCDSEIIRENDDCFIKCLIDKAHDAYFHQDYVLQSYTTYNGECRLCKRYLPALFLERISQQKEMNETITLLLDHIKFMLNTHTDDDIEFVCHSSLSEAFLHVCKLENNANILDNIWVSIKNLYMTEMKDYIRSVISTVCSRCPITTMKWMLSNIDQSIFDMKHLLNRACEFKRLDVVKFLCVSVNYEQLDFTTAFIAAINNVWNDPDEPVSKWLIQNVDHQLFDMKKVTSEVIEVGSVTDLKFLLENIDNNILDMKLVFAHLYKEGGYSVESFLKWMVAKVQTEKLNTLEMLISACMMQDIAVVKYLIKHVDHSLLDLTSVLMSAMNSEWRGSNTDLIEWLFLNVDLKFINMMHIIDKAFKEGRYKELKILIICIKDNLSNINSILRNACENIQMEVIKVVLSVVDHVRLNIRDAVRSVCVLWKIDLLEYFLHNVDHSLYDANYVMEISCRYGWFFIVKWLLDNVEYSSLDIPSAVNIVLQRQFGESNKWLVRLFLQYPLQEKVQITELIQDCCWLDMPDVVKWMLKKIDQKQLDMKSVMNTACIRNNFKLVQWLLSNVSNNLLDLHSAFNNAIHANHPDLNVTLVQLLIGYIDHKLIDMASLLKIGCGQFWFDIVEWVLENADHTLLEVNEEINIFYDNWKYDFTICCDEEISNRRKKYEPLMKLILEKVNHDSLDLHKVFYTACHYGALEVVTLVLENNSHEMLDMNEAMNILYENWKIELSFCYGGHINDISKKYVPLVKLILEKVNPDLLDLNMVLNHACRYGCIDVVTFVLKTVDHEKVNIMTAVNSAYNSFWYEDDIDEQREKKEHLIKLILEKVDHDLLDLIEIMEKAWHYGYQDVVMFLLENTDHKKLDIMHAINDAYRDYDKGDINTRRENNEPLTKLILEKVDHDLLDMKEIMGNACYYGYQDVVTLVLENADHEKLNIMNAINDAYGSFCYADHDFDEKRERNEPLTKLILEKVNHDLLDLKVIMNEACCTGYQDVVTFLLENTDHEKLDMIKAVKIAYSSIIDEDDVEHNIYEIKEKKEPLIKLILEKVDHDLLDLIEIMDKACHYGYQDVVTFLLENTDHEKLDIMKAISNACNTAIAECTHYNICICIYEKLVKLVLEKVKADLLDMEILMNEACRNGWLNIVRWLVENADHEKLNIMNAINDAYNSFCYADHDIDEKRERNEPLIKLILEKVNHDLLDLKVIMNEACCTGYQDVVTFLLENTDHEKLDIMKAISNACNTAIAECTHYNICICIYEKLVKLVLEKVKADLLDMEILMNEACRNGWLNIVRWLVENIDHSMFDVDTAITVCFLHDSDETLDIFMLILQNISQNVFSIGTVIEQASRLNHTEKVLWLLQNKDSSLFEMKYVMNEACRNSNLQIIKYVMENMGIYCFDVRTAMNKACRSSKPNSLESVKWFLDKIPHDMFDLKSAMNNACRYGIVAVVKWLWTTLDRKLFNVKTAWNNACYNCNETLISYLINTMDENMLNISKAMSQACRNYEEGDMVISLHPNMNTPENRKNVLKEACVHTNRPIVKWLLENTDIQPSELKEMLIYSIKAEINKSNDEEKSDHESLVWFMLKHPKVKELERNDLSDVMEAVSSIGQLDMAQQLWNNTEQSMFNTRAIVNTACELGKFEIADWFLQNIELTNIDVQTVMVESCGYGWIKIVKLLLSKFERENFDMSSSMEEACSYGRYEIVKFLLENIDSKLFDTKLVMEKACGYGWKDITLWLFDNIDNTSIDLKSCMFEACTQGRHEIAELFFSKYGASYFDVNILIDKSCNNCGNAGVIKLLIKNFDLKQSHLDIIIKSASKNCWTEIVSSIIDRCKNDQNIMEEAMKNACISGETEIVSILLEKTGTSLLDLQTDMIISCQKGWEEIVSLLLERVEHSLFDFTAAMNEACRCGEADVVELLIQKVNRENFNFDTAIVEACKSHLNENLVLIMLKYINRSTSDIEAVSGKAYDYGWRRVSSRLKRMIYNDISK